MLYLAMTAAEFFGASSVPHPPAWMACHFSSFGPGLTNLPRSLPAGSMLIVDDYIPVAHQDPAVVARQLKELCDALAPSRVLLDLQRPDNPVTGQMVQAILAALPCPVGVSEPYAQGLSCPVFLPPVPPQEELEAYLKPWQGRDIWLEAAPEASAVTVTEEGSVYAPCPVPEGPLPFRDDALCCHYRISVQEGKAVFTLHRTWEDLHQIVQAGKIRCLVGLYQEWKELLGRFPT